jgi:hypothetical protein
MICEMIHETILETITEDVKPLALVVGGDGGPSAIAIPREPMTQWLRYRCVREAVDADLLALAAA